MAEKLSVSNPNQAGGDIVRTQVTDEMAGKALMDQAARMQAAKNLVPADPLNTYTYRASQMRPDDLKASYTRLYGAQPQAGIKYGKMDVPAALRNKISNQLSTASQSGLKGLQRGSIDDYMKIQGMYQGLQDSKVRSEMAEAQQAQADYEAKQAKRQGMISGLFGLGGAAIGGGIGGGAGASIGGGAGSMFGGLL